MKKQKINSPMGAVLIRPASKKGTNKEGITLIALVVTVIVLLILAGITLSLIGGSEGILGRATSAVEENEKATAKEQAELAIQEIQMEYMEEKYVNDSNAQSKKDYILDKLKDGVQTQDYYITATEDGKVIVYEGSNDSGREISKVFVDENGSIQWQEDISTYTIAYDGNGATGGNMEVSVCNYDEESTLSMNGFTKTDCKFLAWNTAADGSGTTYQDGQSVINLTERGITVTLYAQWQENPQAIKVISNTNYGELVDYSANGISSWKIFLNDGKNVYIITSDGAPTSGMRKLDGLWFDRYTFKMLNNNHVDQMVSTLSDTSYWAAYANGTSNGKRISGTTAKGGPNLTQFWTSFNAKYGTNYSADYVGVVRIGNDNLLYFPHTGMWERSYGYWLACYDSPNRWSCCYVAGNTGLTFSGPAEYNYIRPLVCLPTDIKMEKIGDKWRLSN